MIGMTLCSGIGAPEVAAPWVDWRWQSEVAAFPSAVLAHRIPEATNLGDMTKYEEWPNAVVDVLCGGTPCQDASIGYSAGAGRPGLGLDGERSGLAHAFVGCVDRYRPGFILWENVPNLLSARLAPGFLTFAKSIADLGYHLAWRVLDAACFGPSDQPRRRLFLVGCRDDERAAAAILLEPEGHRRNRRAQAPAAPVLTARGGMAFDDRTPCILEPSGARIATPTEWERAMGFPDGWTAVPWRGRGPEQCPDGPRFHALGNSMAVPCVGWILDRIRQQWEGAA